ncbi:hypothetical protein [Streptomyces scopuliridis]|uniref:hypothetical protein n=1 Tax=Streptomyces scopuliridis TaxID=452529 RepID=UPI00368AAD8E
MTIEEGHFYRDSDEDIWQAVSFSVLMFVAHADGDPNVSAFDVVPAERIADRNGPLVEVRPTGWEEV